MVSLKINGIDFTKYITEKSYSVDSNEITEEWEDADIYFHTGTYRNRIEGSFELMFINDTDYNNFINNMAIATSDGLTTLNVYVGGLVNDMVESQFKCKIKSSSKRDAKADRVVNKLTVQIKER